MRVLRAQQINRVLGGAFVAPWEVDELPGDWMDALLALMQRLPQLQEGKKKVANAFERFRKDHERRR